MTDDLLRLVAVTIWQSFSLAFVITLLARAALSDGKPGAIPIARPLRIAVAAFALLGLFGAASIVGAAGPSQSIIAAILVLSATCGIALAYRIGRFPASS
jgi:hypothetical protein